MKKLKNIFLTVLLVCLCVTQMLAPASAATTVKCYTVATANTAVYSNTSLKTRCGSIYPSDELTVLQVTGTYCKVSYYITGTSRTKEGFIPTSAILWGTTGNTYTSKGRITTHVRPNGNTYGYVDAGDQVKVLGTSGGWVQIKYPGAGCFKYAFISASDAQTYLFGTSTSSGSTSATKTMTNALYGINTSSSRITCGFDGYTTTCGRHEGIDFSLGLNKPIYSLTRGVITRVTFGSVGSNGLSTVAIYNSATGKTVIYLHAKPLDSLYVGQSISAGQQIGYESWRGVSYSSSAHTHVEVRNGYCTSASKSVNDPVLNNPNPTPFWNSMGYEVR